MIQAGIRSNALAKLHAGWKEESIIPVAASGPLLRGCDDIHHAAICSILQIVLEALGDFQRFVQDRQQVGSPVGRTGYHWSHQQRVKGGCLRGGRGGTLGTLIHVGVVWMRSDCGAALCCLKFWTARLGWLRGFTERTSGQVTPPKQNQTLADWKGEQRTIREVGNCPT